MIREIMKDETLWLKRRSRPCREICPWPKTCWTHWKPIKERCVGMVANMIGVNKRIIAFDNEGAYMVMFNPEIVKRSGLYQTKEGCLSIWIHQFPLRSLLNTPIVDSILASSLSIIADSIYLLTRTRPGGGSTCINRTLPMRGWLSCLIP